MKSETPTATSFWTPGASEWEWWRKRPADPVAAPSEAPSAGTPAIFAIPAHQCSSVPVWVSSADPDVIEQVLEVELERLGVVVPGGSGTHLAWKIVGSVEARRLVCAVVVPPALDPVGAKEKADWQGFLPAPLMLPSRPRAIVLWQEMGRWVAGFSREGQWVHFQSLGRREPDSALLQDIHCLYLELDGRRMVDHVETLVLWKSAGNAPMPDDIAEKVATVLDLDFRVVEKPAPDPKLAEGFVFEPGDIAEARERRERSRKAVRTAVLVAAIYGILIGFGIFDLFRRQGENSELRDQVAQREPEAAVVRDARARWTELEPALERDRYPVELFYQVARLFPEEGLRMTSFEITNGGQIVVHGEASSVPVAIRFKADLEGNPELQDYEWEIPPPESNGDVAEFVAFGTYRYAVPDEDAAGVESATAFNNNP
ncbi:MAG: hypothetical protein KDN19_16290 [Verrucomicrobiae bacterium]|nr:hypothetical protein [Verrucomicrobiae bacterium]